MENLDIIRFVAEREDCISSKIAIDLLDHIQFMQEVVESAYKVANNALYLNDSSDFRSALGEVCSIIKPPKGDIIDIKYLEEKSIKPTCTCGVL